MSISKKIITDLSLNDLELILEQIQKNESSLLYYNNIEIIRKYISAKSLYLKKDLKNKFGDLYADYLNLFNLIFTEILKKNLFKKNGLLDITIINSVLSLKKVIKIDPILSEEIQNQLIKLEFHLLSLKEINLIKDSLVQEFIFDHNNLKKESQHSESVVILCPNQYSLYTGCVVKLCNYFSIPIEAIIVRKFSLERFFEESKRDGYFYLLKKIFYKLILKGNDNLSYSDISLKYIFNKLGIIDKNIKKIIKNQNIKLLYVNNFKKLNESISSLKSNTALFTGGGIISDSIINKFNYGIINLHVGNLPKYKGMDTTEAAILEGHFDSMALTTHLMSKKVDSGPIMTKYTFKSDGYSKIGTIFNEVSSLFPFMLIDSYLGLISGRYKMLNQNKEGKLYFTLNQELKDLVNKILFSRSKKNNKPESIKNFANNILRNFI
jgi:folate-dependent phosphoribosylglycinamide formyltransferase PurN